MKKRSRKTIKRNHYTYFAAGVFFTTQKTIMFMFRCRKKRTEEGKKIKGTEREMHYMLLVTTKPHFTFLVFKPHLTFIGMLHEIICIYI